MEIGVFWEECILEVLNNVFFMILIQYNWNVPLDRFMMNADIKLFLMGLGYITFDELNANQLRTCFEYAALEGYKFQYGEKFRSKATIIENGFCSQTMSC